MTPYQAELERKRKAAARDEFGGGGYIKNDFDKEAFTGGGKSAAQRYDAARRGGFNPEVSNILGRSGVVEQVNQTEFQGPMPDGSAGYMGNPQPRLMATAPRAKGPMTSESPFSKPNWTPEEQNNAIMRDMMNNATGGIEAQMNQRRMLMAGAAQYNTQKMRDWNGQGINEQEMFRRRDWYRDHENAFAIRQMAQERNLMPERLAGIDQQTQFGVEDRRGEAATGVAEIGREQAFGVADREGSAAENVAGINAGASRYGSSMDVLGQTIDSVGGVVGSWLNQGVERIRRDGQNDRLDKLIAGAGVKAGQVYQDATGRGVPLQQPMEAGTKPIFDETGQKQIGREITLPSGATKTQLFKESPFPPGTPEYDPWGKADGDADESDTAQTTDVQKELVANIRKHNEEIAGGDDRHGLLGVRKSRRKSSKDAAERLIKSGYRFASAAEASELLPPGTTYTGVDGMVRRVPRE